MGDRAPITVMIYEVPEGQEQHVRDALGEYGINEDYELASAIFSDEQSLGVPAELIELLHQYGVTAAVWQDAKYEWDGTLNRCVPGLGVHEVNCTQEGDPYITETQLARLRKNATTVQSVGFGPTEVLDANVLLDSVDIFLGRAFSASIAEIATRVETQRAAAAT